MSWVEDKNMLREIALALGAGEVAEESLIQLDAILLRHEAAPAYFAEMLDQDGSLRDAARSQLIAAGSCEPLGMHNDLAVTPRSLVSGTATPRRGLPVRWFSAADLPSVASHAAAVLFAALLLAWFGYLPSKSSDQTQREAERAQASTQLVSMSQCVWQGELEEGPSVGKLFSSGNSLSLLEGIAEFEAGLSPRRRALVRVSGPATVFVSQDGMPELSQGLMTLRTYDLSSPLVFPVSAGSLELSANTYLGISVEGETTSVHVFTGAVTVRRHVLHSELTDGASFDLRSGEAATYDSGHGVGATPRLSGAVPHLFAFTKSLSAEKLVVTEAYRKAVLRSDPAIYWQFEDRSAREYENAGYAEGQRARLRGEASLRRFAENQVLEFGLTPTVGAVVSEGLWPQHPLKSYSVELWTKPSHYHYSAILGLVDPKLTAEKKQKHGLFFGLYGPQNLGDDHPHEIINAFRFVHRSPVATMDGAECNPSLPYAVREWQHIVMRKDRAEHSLFLDGEIVATTTDSNPLPAGLRLIIGQLYTNTSVSGRAFTGQIDEVALYEHALTDAEVLEHYRLVDQ